jgi:RimJ/RimL family protein N-acetyltransferase
MNAERSIETVRLRLRPPTGGDAEAIFVRYAGDPEVTRFVGWPRHQSIEDTHAFLAFSAAEWARWPAGPYLIYSRDSGQLLGSTGLSFRHQREAMTGYVLAKDAWGKGLATEALVAMIELARGLRVETLVASCHPSHRPSLRVLEKCGFVLDDPPATLTEFPNLTPGVAQAAARYARRLTDTGSEVIGLDHVQLAMPAGQEAAARAFYGAVLGLVEEPKPANLAPRGGVWFRAGRLRLHLGVDPDFRAAREAHPALLVRGLKELAEKCRAAGHPPVVDEPLAGFDRCYVFDPFGNRLELLEPLVADHAGGG